MLYKAAICLLEDITSLNLAVSLTELRALRLSGRQNRGGECIDSSKEGGQTQQQQRWRAGEKKLNSVMEKSPAYIYSVETVGTQMHTQ